MVVLFGQWPGQFAFQDMDELPPVNTLQGEAPVNVLRGQAPYNRLANTVEPNLLRGERSIITGPARGIVTDAGPHGVIVPYLDHQGNEVGHYSTMPISQEVMARMPKSRRRR